MPYLDIDEKDKIYKDYYYLEYTDDLHNEDVILSIAKVKASLLLAKNILLSIKDKYGIIPTRLTSYIHQDSPDEIEDMLQYMVDSCNEYLNGSDRFDSVNNFIYKDEDLDKVKAKQESLPYKQYTTIVKRTGLNVSMMISLY